MIYMLEKDINFVSLELLNDSDYKFLLDQVHVAKSITAFEQKIYLRYGYNGDDDQRETDDYPCIGALYPAFNKVAVDKLDFLRDFGELLPVYSDDQTFYVYNVTNLLDIVDFEASELEYFEGELIRAKRIVLREVYFDRPVIFKVCGIERGPIFANCLFKNAFVGAGLKGIEFIPVQLTSAD